ncbi:ATP-binding cassette domain-containing protein [Rhodococcus sp. IEGM 1366]|uniref:ABC transporter ATP-binding protein n=1 Tax=Rhodococcus sp. IEGM 1366 TaxID=3082223 RepID=UPI0029535760|nr:ATP-binding cassette domain-containing protein [Rhodococcus sp. IEGM 1366]MDV8070999.1 ATP-binding cassette domain-containing protein [Rhodococcus sp. IEGM 1366]
MTLSADAGETLGIVGPNGSGKSTFLNAINRLVPSTGRIKVNSVETEDMPFRSSGVRFGRTFQTPQIHPDLTCLENVALGSPNRFGTGLLGAWAGFGSARKAERKRLQLAEEYLELAKVPPAVFHQLSGEQPLSVARGIEMARALAREPHIILLDEPAAGLNDDETAELAEVIRNIRSESRCTIVIEHKIDFIDHVSDKVVVFESGQVAAMGPPGEIWTDPRVIEAYLGVAHAED